MKSAQKAQSSWGSEPVEQEYWLSYSDLMAGLLMVFALMLLVAIYHYGQRILEIEGRIDELATMQAREDIVTGVQDAIAGDPNPLITIDTVTALITMKDGVLFEEGSSRLRPAGQAALTSFAERILPIVLGSEAHRSHLREIIVEGHTNDNPPPQCARAEDPSRCNFQYNLRLSQDRAYEVMSFLLNTEASAVHRNHLRRLMTASGRSWSWPVCSDGQVHFIYDANQCAAVDDERSRRIEIQFRLNDDEVLREVKKLLDAWR